MNFQPFSPSASQSLTLALVGMPGSGKTTLGRELATRYGRRFLDLDAEMERHAGRSVAALFAAEGEAAFRVREAETLAAVLQRPQPLVLATGGGTPCFHGNMALLNARALTLWLDVPVAELAARLQPEGENETRPLVARALAARPELPAAAALEAWLTQTLAARGRFYAQARLRCAGAAGCAPPAVAALLAAAASY